jgi:hypothetical protein
MADDISTLAAQLVELRRAYRSGVLKVQHKDNVVEYRSLEDLRSAIASIEAEIGTLQTRTVLVRSTKGW